jgi:hypothetical protein
MMQAGRLHDDPRPLGAAHTLLRLPIVLGYDGVSDTGAAG